MIFHDIQQQSVEWFKVRLGLATASCFDRIITPKTGEPSKSMDAYANQLIGELVTGQPGEKFESYWMERGAAMESEASASYEAITDLKLDRGGFITNDDMTIGVSPDRRVMDQNVVVGAVEIKCPSPAVHVANLLRKDDIDPSYIPQVQGQILIGGFDFVDWFSYHPDFPPAHIRTFKDEKFCEKLKLALDMFLHLMQQKINILSERGVIIPQRPILSFYAESQKSYQSIMGAA